VGVVPADVAQDFVAVLVAGVEFEVSKLLDLEGCEEAFGRRVVPAVALAAHAADDACGQQRPAAVAATALTVEFDVVDGACRWSRYTDGFVPHVSEEHQCPGEAWSVFEQPWHRERYRSDTAHLTGAATSLFLVNHVTLLAKGNRVVPLATLRLRAVRDTEFDGLYELNAIQGYERTGIVVDFLANAVLPEAIVCSVLRGADINETLGLEIWIL
jgi:hypothetical protein